MPLAGGIWLTLALFAVLCSLTVTEIHRAKSLNTKPRLRAQHHHNTYAQQQQYDNLPSTSVHNDRSSAFVERFYESDDALFGNFSSSSVCGSSPHWLNRVVWGHERQTWIFAIFSAFLVGLSGIFPLLIIPLEAGKALRNGVATDRLKLLLSFAVGGLLGDVFLHLLPEAWAHLQQLGGDRRGHMLIGQWLLTGLLSFFIIQKIFPDDDDEEEELKREEEIDKSVHLADGCNGNRLHVSGLNGSNKAIHVNRTAMNGFNGSNMNGAAISELNKAIHTNGTNVNGLNVNNGIVKTMKINSEVKHLHCGENRIKTCGWLNLMANMIDNFTHGLAVAGSYSISTKTGMLTTVAILLHEIPHEIGDFAILLRAGFDRWKAAKAQLLTASGGMCGALLALAAESTKEAGDTTAWILPFTAGGFIYIALVTVIPDLMKDVHPMNSLKQMICICAGITTMGLVAFLVE